MKKLSLLLAVFALANSANADHWYNRPNVVRAADLLAEEIEQLDTALHNISAPEHVIQKMHHYEETATEFAELVRTASYYEANQEMNHIRQDYALIRNEFQAHPYLLNNPQVYTEWRHVRTAYRNLDHQMFMNSNRWTKEDIEQLEKDLEELEADHK